MGHGSDDKPVPQNEAYLILSKEERAKGFVRPVRTAYLHIGEKICGAFKTFVNDSKFYLCAAKPGHKEECSVWSPVTESELARFKETGYIRGCGTETKMGTELAETYARSPKFYGATYCVHCQKHRPVLEFVWSDDNSPVGS